LRFRTCGEARVSEERQAAARRDGLVCRLLVVLLSDRELTSVKSGKVILARQPSRCLGCRLQAAGWQWQAQAAEDVSLVEVAQWLGFLAWYGNTSLSSGSVSLTFR